MNEVLEFVGIGGAHALFAFTASALLGWYILDLKTYGFQETHSHPQRSGEPIVAGGVFFSLLTIGLFVLTVLAEPGMAHRASGLIGLLLGAASAVVLIRRGYRLKRN